MKKPLEYFDNVELFNGLPDVFRAELGSKLMPMNVSRGQTLLTEGAEAIALYFVVSGRFGVTTKTNERAVAEIGAGKPIGEIAFLSGGLRTATVTALRDSLVLRLTREQFDAVCKENPEAWPILTRTLAKRLAKSNTSSGYQRERAPGTIAIIPAGDCEISDFFVYELISEFRKHLTTSIVGSDDYSWSKSAADSDFSSVTTSLNALEANHGLVVYRCDDTLTEWTKIALRQADLVVSVGNHGPNVRSKVQLNLIEEFANNIHKNTARRLVLLHSDIHPVQNTINWLLERDVHMHHHVCLNLKKGLDRFVRFILGKATGLVLCGGGALCSAHIGVYRALRAANVEFDIMCGTSGGAAMAGAFAAGATPQEVDKRVHDMFVGGKAMQKYNLPVYSLLDHRNFDRQLRLQYGDVKVEDLWTPYFAAATNLSTSNICCINSGPLWQAIRASSAIPALLPPFFTDSGDMLADGALMNNVPIEMLHSAKSGPNVVVSFELPNQQKFEVDYSEIPTRLPLLWQKMTGANKDQLSSIPSVSNVLMRALMTNEKSIESQLQPEDILLSPPISNDFGPLEWHKHTDLEKHGFKWVQSALRELNSEERVVFAKLTGNVNGAR